MTVRMVLSGQFDLSRFSKLGEEVVFESGVLVFHPENIEIGDGGLGHHRRKGNLNLDSAFLAG